MKTQDIIKYALMAAAAWLAYVWLRDSGMLAQLGIGPVNTAEPTPAQPQVPGGQSPTQPTQPTQPTPGEDGTNTSAGGSTSTGSLKEQLRIAAQSASSASGGLMHFWQWNYYLPSNTAKPDPFAMTGWESTDLGRPPASVEDVEQTPLTLDQYWALVQPVLAPGGVSGLRGVNHWGQQPSQWYGQAPNAGGMGRTMKRGRGDLGGGGF